MLSNYFNCCKGVCNHFVLWQSLMTTVTVYQCIDMILTIANALNQDISGDRLIYVYRVVIQALLIISFHIAMSKLKPETFMLINVISLLKYICLILAWTETDYNLIYTSSYDQRSHFAEIYLITIAFLVAIESQFIRTIIINFSLFYSLFRISYFNNHTEIIGSIRIIFIHLVIQFILLYHQQLYIQKNDKLIQQSFSPLLTQRAGILTQKDEQQKKVNHEINIEEEHINSNYVSCKVDYDVLLTYFQCGIYIYETYQQPIKTVNSFMSHIVLVDEQLNNEFTSLELYDFGMLHEEACTILPKFHRSKDISLFCKFIQTLDQNILFENAVPTEKKEIQLFIRKMQMKTLIEHLQAFSHSKFAQTQQILDFSLKIYLKKEKLYTQVILNPVNVANKPQIVLYVQDLTDEPFILQLQQFVKNSDELIQTISSKIKEPLNCTLSMLELVQNQVSQEQQDKFILPALAGCKLLISTANDIQDYVTLRREKKIVKNLMDIHTREFISECLNIIKTQALFRGLSMSVNIKQTVPIFLRTDPNRVRQIILSLLVKSIQATMTGFIEISCQKSPLLSDHVELIVKVMAQSVNESILDEMDNTFKYLKQQTLIHSQVIDLIATPKQFSFSLITAFYISLGIAIMPFEFNQIKTEEGTQFYFILLIKNENPNFNKQLTTKRQSALTQNKSQFQQVFGKQSSFKRHQSQRLTEISRVQVQKNLIKIKRDSQIETTSERRDSQACQFGQGDGSDNNPQLKILDSVSQISEQEDSSNSDNDSKDEFKNNDQCEVCSSKSSVINEKIEKISKQKRPSQFIDGLLQVNEPKPRKISVSVIQNKLTQQLQQPLSAQRRDSLLTFGGRSSVYSSMRLSSVILNPNELLDCFEKMERIKQQQFIYKCKCPKVLICEQNDFDLYAISHQLGNLQIPYIYTMQRMHVVDQLKKQFEQYKTCCRGYNIIFLGIEYVNEQLSQECSKIKAVLEEFKRDTRLVGLTGFQDEESKVQIKSLPFHDCLSKPIMIDALLFILAKWVRL